MKYLITILCCWLTASALSAQSYAISGKVVDQQDASPIISAAIRLLHTDSTFVIGATTQADGRFTIKAPQAGRYIVSVSYIGYSTSFIPVRLTTSTPKRALGDIAMSVNTVHLGEAEVTATLAKVEQKGDTTQFNASSYRIPPGSTLESLIEQLPGVDVQDDGSIKWNGKTVTNFLINGKDFFKGNTDVAMKNLPPELVNKIKAYDKKSDYTEQTGIDDGEESTVLDLQLKRDLNESWFSNLVLGLGNKKRYNNRLFVNRFDDHSRVTLFGALNNTGNRGFNGRSNGRGFGARRSGLTAFKNIGLDFQWDNSKKRFTAGRFEIGGNVRYSYSDNDLLSMTNAETFLTSNVNSSFSNSKAVSGNASTNLSTELRLEWNPDSVTTVSFRPSFTHRHGQSQSNTQSATFNDDPLSIDSVFDPLLQLLDTLQTPQRLRAIAVNRNMNQSLGTTLSNETNATLNVVRRLNNKGRNISLRATAGYSYARNQQYSRADIRYLQPQVQELSRFNNQFSLSPSKNWNYSTRLSYTEPLVGKWFAQARYQFSYRSNEGERNLYQLDELPGWGYLTGYPLGMLPSTADSLQLVYNIRNSRNATYRYYNQSAQLSLNYNSSNVTFQAGVDFQPQTSKMAYTSGQTDTTITRHVFNMAPRIRLKYELSKTTNLMLFYRGSASQPSMTNLLDVTDDSNPLYITRGNPSLRPSWNNDFNAFFNTYHTERQQGMMASLRFTQTSNAISNAIAYDAMTGVRTTRPENINGNWNVNGDFTFNTPLDHKKLLTLATTTSLGYNNAVGFVSVDRGSSVKNTTKSFNIFERLNMDYRTSWFDIGALGSINYQKSSNVLQSAANLNTYTFTYGLNGNVSLPWDLSISTDMGMNSRRGYTDPNMNTDELIWNAQLSKSFLKNNVAMISVQFYDLLQQQSNISRTLNAQMRSDAWNNAINSYFMVTFSYKFSLLSGTGGKAKQSDMRNRYRRERGGYPPSMPMMRMGNAR